MAPSRSTQPPSGLPDTTKSTELSVDHALALSLADETEAALRWGAAALELGRRGPDAVLVTSKLLEQMGRRRAAVEGLGLAVGQAIEDGNLPLAMAAVGELRALGVDATGPIEQVAATFCRGSSRLRASEPPQVLPQLGEFQPLSPFLTGPALASKAAHILEAAVHASDEVVGRELGPVEPLPLFSNLPQDALKDLLGAFETLLVAAGESVIREGEESGAAFLVARGELEIARRNGSSEAGPPTLLTRLGAGSFFGEMALLSHLPGAATVVATRPSILLVARRERIEAISQRHPELAEAMAAHCRRLSVANLGWASPVIVAVPPRERATLVDRFETRIFESGDRIVEAGQEADGLHLIVSGEVAVVAHDGGEQVALAVLLPGETVGEVELVLCRPAVADAIAVRPTASLYLPREEFMALVQDHPAILHGLYGIAVRRHNETRLALDAGSSDVADELLDEVPAPPPPVIEPPAPSSRSGRAAAWPLTTVRPGSVPPPPVTPARTTANSPVREPRRRTLPPPMMPARPEAPSPIPSRRVEVMPQEAHAAEEHGGAPVSVPPPSRAPSVVPTIATIRPGDQPSRFWERSKSFGQMTFAAAAAGTVAFVALRGEPARTTPSAGARGADLSSLDEPRAPVLTVPPVVAPAPAALSSAAPAATSRSVHFVAPAQTATIARPRTVAVTVEPAPVNVAAPPAPPVAPSAGSAATSQQAPKPAAPPAPTFASAAAPTKDALSATEFGGRE